MIFCEYIKADNSGYVCCCHFEDSALEVCQAQIKEAGRKLCDDITSSVYVKQPKLKLKR
jgi:hypothetical protein